MPPPAVLSQPLAALVEHLDSDLLLDDLLSTTRQHLKCLLETALDVELTTHLGCGHYARSGARRGHRNGCYTRDFATAFGLLTDLRVPRCRDGSFQPQLLQRYRRRSRQIDTFIQHLFFAGVSTRGVGEVLELLLGIAPSPSTVSAILRRLDRQVQAYHQRPLADDYLYLFLDAVHVPVAELPEARKRPVLVAYGISADGRRHLLDFRVAASESSGEWERFLTALYQRGLRGEQLRLIITDGGAGLLHAVEQVYGEIPHQLCWAHKLRNVGERLKKSQRRRCLGQAVAIYRARNRSIAAWRSRTVFGLQSARPSAIQLRIARRRLVPTAGGSGRFRVEGSGLFPMEIRRRSPFCGVLFKWNRDSQSRFATTIADQRPRRDSNTRPTA